MKKVFPLIAVVAFIFVSCNLPSINKGEIDFSLDEEIADKALNIAKETAGEDYPITVEVNIHGRLEKSQSKVIKTKDEAADLSFSFDIPKNSPSDVEVLITIDKSVVLYRGVTQNVKPDDITGPVEVALRQVFEINEPTIRTTVNGKIVKNIRQKNFEISVVDINGNPYPRCVKATLVYNAKDPYEEFSPVSENIILNGNESKAISFDDCFDNYLHVSQITLEIPGNFVESKTVQAGQNAYPAVYEPSEYYAFYTNDKEIVLLKDIDNLSVKDDVTPLSARSIAGYSFMNGKVKALKSDFTTGNAIYKNMYTMFEYTTQLGTDKWELQEAEGFNDPTTMGDNVSHSGRAYYYDIDSAIEYAFTYTEGKNMVYRHLNRPNKDQFLEAVELEDSEDFSMKACVYDNKAYIMKYGTIDDPVELRVYSLDNGKRIATIDITQRYPLLYKDIDKLKDLYTTDFAYDIIVQDDMVYMLYNQLGAEMSNYASSNGVSRGVLMEINPQTNTISREFGWTGTPNGTIKCDKPDWDVRRFSPDREDSTTQFFSPLKFVALKPKKLVIADSGMFLYVENETIKAKDVSRVVEIDLETFTMTSQKSIKGSTDETDISCFFTNLKKPVGSGTLHIENPNSGSSISNGMPNVRIE